MVYAQILYILALLDDADIDWLVSAGTRRSLAKGEVVIHKQTHFDSLFIVLEGLLTVSVVAESGKVLAHLGPGEVLGEISLLDSRPSTATVTATTPAQVLDILKCRLTNQLEANSEFAARFYRALATFTGTALQRADWQLAPGKSIYDQDVECPGEIDRTCGMRCRSQVSGLSG